MDHLDRFYLFSLLARPANSSAVPLPNGIGGQGLGWVEAIEREDGSGFLFNVRIRWASNPADFTTVFIRCRS